MKKRFRRDRSICNCKSPRNSLNATALSFNWYEADVWTEIAKYLDGRSLVKLAVTCRWFRAVIMHDSIWRFACLRDLQVPAPIHVAFSWFSIYSSLADGSHSHTFREKGKHIDWMRIGAFFFDSKEALVTEILNLPLKIRRQDDAQNMLESYGVGVLSNIKQGIWIAGTMQTLDARHIELFLCDGYRDGSWEYELIGTRKLEKPSNAASGAIIDLKHLKDVATAGKYPYLELSFVSNFSRSGVFNLKLWAGKEDDLQPKAMITFHTVAVNTNLQLNQGLVTKYYTMKAGSDGEVVSIRICQQLL